MAKTVKGGHFKIFFNIHSVAKFQKIEAGLEKFCEKKTKK